MNLSHYTRKSLNLNRLFSVAQVSALDLGPFTKPAGLWISVDGENDWKSWCEGNMENWMEGVRRYRITLNKQTPVLRVQSMSELKSFESEFGVDTGLGLGIDWSLVEKRYLGIIIAPYQYRARFSTMWYYGWDCASGCIWNPDAVDTITEVDVDIRRSASGTLL